MGSSPLTSVVDAEHRSHELRELYVVDGSAVPTSLGVNPQLSIMTLATRAAWLMRERPLPG
jgi:choline dehydrogenase-like flavoprotein